VEEPIGIQINPDISIIRGKTHSIEIVGNPNLPIKEPGKSR
jgi:hypothetical protein